MILGVIALSAGRLQHYAVPLGFLPVFFIYVYTRFQEISSRGRTLNIWSVGKRGPCVSNVE
jgi:hypothetical protein